MSLLGGKAIPTNGFDEILGHPTADVVEIAEPELGLRVSLVRREAIPVDGLSEVLRNTRSAVIHPPKPGLRLGNTLIGEFGEDSQRQLMVLSRQRRFRPLNAGGRGQIDRLLLRALCAACKGHNSDRNQCGTLTSDCAKSSHDCCLNRTGFTRYLAQSNSRSLRSHRPLPVERGALAEFRTSQSGRSRGACIDPNGRAQAGLKTDGSGRPSFLAVGGADRPELLQQISAVRADQVRAGIPFRAPAAEYAERSVDTLADEQVVDIAGGVPVRGSPDI